MKGKKEGRIEGNQGKTKERTVGRKEGSKMKEGRKEDERRKA